MGIQKLLTRLQEYSIPLELKRLEISPGEESVQVIVDGPAFAHFVFSQEMFKDGAPNTLVSSLSYRQIGVATVEWLKSLETYNANVAAIYFDGGLPVFKRKERLKRLESKLFDQIAFKVKLNANARAWALSTYFPHPFLVPAVIEALLSSDYKHCVSLVDGEADAYCAARARSTGGIILTSDSDLVIHDVGNDGRIVYLNDLAMSFPKETSFVPFSVPCFHPAGIARQLGLKSLVRLAFEAQNDRHVSLKRCAYLVQKYPIPLGSYQTFAEQYETQHLESTQEASYLAKTFHTTIDMIDPRVSEYLLHSGVAQSKQMDMSDITPNSTDSRIYLPMLHDDYAKPCAWQSGEYFRQLAYSIVRLLNIPGRTREFRREASEICGHYIEALSEDEIIAFCQSFTENVMHVKEVFVAYNTIQIWRIFGMKYVVETRRAHDRVLPLKADMEDVLMGNVRDIDWVYIHLSAEYQAAVYSLRILQQCVAVYMASTPKTPVEPTCHEAITELHKFSSTLPAIVDLLPEAQEGSQKQWQDATTALVEDLGISECPEIYSKRAWKRRNSAKSAKKRNRA